MKKFIETLHGKSFEAPPIWMMRQAGRYLPEYRAVRAKAGGFWNMVYTPAYAAEVTLQPIERFGFDAAIIFSDILVVPHALGVEIEFAEGEGPQVTPVINEAELAKLNPQHLAERFGKVYETVARTKAGLGPETALIGFCGAPWTVAAYVLEGRPDKTQPREFARAKAIAHANPQFMQKVLDLIVETSIDYLDGQVRAGAEVLQIFDSWAGVLTPQEFADWVIAPTTKLVAGLRARHPDVPIIGFPRAAEFAMEDYIKKTGVTALQLDTHINSAHAQAAARAGTPVQGWLDPEILLRGGDELRTAVRDIKLAMRGLPHIFNLGHGVIKETPPDHVAQLIKFVRDE
jgi:uroporphyrinogen decarboxylase